MKRAKQAKADRDTALKAAVCDGDAAAAARLLALLDAQGEAPMPPFSP